MLEFLVTFGLTQNDPAKLEIAARLRKETKTGDLVAGGGMGMRGGAVFHWR